MSVGTLVLGLLLALVLDTGPDGGEFVLFGWIVAGLGAVGVVLHFLMPMSTRSAGGRQAGGGRAGGGRAGGRPPR